MHSHHLALYFILSMPMWMLHSPTAAVDSTSLCICGYRDLELPSPQEDTICLVAKCMQQQTWSWVMH